MTGSRTALVHDEGGWALVTAVILMTVMVMLGLGTLSVVDQQQSASGVERQKDTAFNLAEGAMNATAFSLGTSWPGVAAGTSGSGVSPYPSCTQASTGTVCPDTSTLTNLFNSPDTNVGGANWTVDVYDNGVDAGTGQSSGSFYSEALTTKQPHYDANGDGKLWVRAQGTVRGHNRVLVEEVQVEQIHESLPTATIIAGNFTTSNNGKKTVVDTSGADGQVSPIELRCHASDPNCLSIGKPEQVSPTGSYVKDFAGGSSLSSAALARLKATAIANGTYFTSCPSSLPNGVVYIQSSAQCSYNGGQINSQAKPGLLIDDGGTLFFNGNMTFHGVVYATNTQGSTGTVVETHGNSQVCGSIQVDGLGVVVGGSSGNGAGTCKDSNGNALSGNTIHDSGAFAGVLSFGAATLIPGTFRQLAIG